MCTFLQCTRKKVKSAQDIFLFTILNCNLVFKCTRKVGMTYTLERMHSDAQFAGPSSVSAHVEMMGVLGIGNNPMVGATVAVAIWYNCQMLMI